MFDRDTIRGKFDEGVSFETFVQAAAAEEMDAPWRQRHEQLALDETQTALVGSFTRRINVVSMTGPWCGDCALSGAAMQRIAEANPCITLRFLNRNLHPDLQIAMRINAGDRVPITFFMAEDFEPVSVVGDRTLSRYRSMARKMLGPDSGVLAESPEDPVRAVLDELLVEFERVHLLLRLSGRLRQLHGD